jgi:DNA-binding beta-propeller fold protein YncE
MKGNALFFLVLIPFVFTACGSSTEPIPAVCNVEPAFIDFGQVLAPLNPGETEEITRTFSITNRVYTNSDRGNADLAGTLGIHEPEGSAHAPDVQLVPALEDSGFVIPPRVTVSYDLRVTVRSDTEAGTHTGFISLGVECGDIPYVIRVYVRQQPPPLVVDFWGRTGDETGAFDRPTNLAVDQLGDVYVLEDNHDRVQVFDHDGEFLRAFSWLRDEQGFPATGTDFIRPADIEVDAEGRIHMSDVGWPRVFLFDRYGFLIKSWGNYLKTGAAAFSRPYSLAVDAEGYVYVLDPSLYRVLKFDISQVNPQILLDEWGSQGTAPGQFGTVSDIEIDGEGNIYLSDWEHDAVHKFSPDGQFITRWGTPGTFIGQFDRPLGLGIDADNNVYVADSRNARVQKFDSDGNFLTAWGERGAGVTQFSLVYDVAIGPDGLIYVTDAANDRVIVYQNQEPASATTRP